MSVAVFTGCCRSQEKRQQNLSCLATMAQQCAVAGHSVGMVQERSNAAASVPAADQEYYCTAAAAEHPVPTVEAAGSQPKLVHTQNTADSRCVQVPVESAQTVGCVNYDDRPQSSLVDIRSRCPEFLGSRQSNADFKHAAVIVSDLPRDTVDEARDQRCHPISDENPDAAAAGAIIGGCTNIATVPTTFPVLQQITSLSTGQINSATSPNISLKLNPSLLNDDKLFSVKTATVSGQLSTPGWGADVDLLSDSDSESYSDVWVPRTQPAADAMSGIWITCGQALCGHSTVRRECKLRAEWWQSPDPVFRRRVPPRCLYPMKWRRAEALELGNGRSFEMVHCMQMTARDRRRACWRTATVNDRLQHIDCSQFASVLSHYASPRQRSFPPTSMHHHLSNDRQGTPTVHVDGRLTRADVSVDKIECQQQRTKDNSEQPLQVPSVSATLVSSLLDRLSAFRHGRSSLHDERHKQQKLIENRARKALRTIDISLYLSLSNIIGMFQLVFLSKKIISICTALRTISIILGAFIICWTPWHVLSLIIGFCGDNVCVSNLLYDISYWLCYLNSPMNPFCYALANHQFKKTFLRILRLDWHRN